MNHDPIRSAGPKGLWSPIARSVLAMALAAMLWTLDTPGSAMAEDPTPAAVACAYLQGRVPSQVVQAALANPTKVYGYQQNTNPNRARDPYNPPRTSLTLANPNLIWNALSNPVIFRAGCPRPEGMP